MTPETQEYTVDLDLRVKARVHVIASDPFDAETAALECWDWTDCNPDPEVEVLGVQEITS
jgi:hypothetical protein